MRSKRLLAGVVLTGFSALTLAGCGDQGNTKIIDAPAVQPGESKEVPKSIGPKGGGKNSSGSKKFNPGADS